MLAKTGEVIITRKHNIKPIIWEDSYQVCQLLQRETSEAIRAGKKISHLAQKAKMSPTTVSNIAYGITKDPRSNTVINLLRMFGYKVTIS